MVLGELSRLGPNIRPHGEILLLYMQKKPTFLPDSEAFNSCIGDGFLVPELKDEWSVDCYRATWIRRCNCPLPTRLGGGKGSLKLPKSPGHAVPGVA